MVKSTLMVSLVIRASSCFLISCRFQLKEQDLKWGEVKGKGTLLVIHFGYEFRLAFHDMEDSHGDDHQQNV